MPWRRWILKSLLRITETITGSISAPLSFSFLRTYLHRGGERWGNLLWWGNPCTCPYNFSYGHPTYHETAILLVGAFSNPVLWLWKWTARSKTAVFTLKSKNVACLCWWLILFFVKPCRLVRTRMSCQMVEWLQDRMQLQSLNSLCSSNAVWHRFWTENWPKQYTAKGRAQDRKNRSKFVGSGKEGLERTCHPFFIVISNIIFFQTRISG